MSDSDKGLTQHSESANGGRAAPTKKGGKFKRHCSRFWWIYVIVFIIVVLVVVLPIIYVGFPNLAQKGVDESTIEISRVSVSDPTESSVRLSQDFYTMSDSSFHPTLDAFDAEIGLEGDEPYGTVRLPSVVSAERVPGSFEQVMDITNVEAFARYNRALLGNKEITQFVRGRTGLHQGKLPMTTVDFSKTTTLKGFNKLEGLNITAFHLLEDDEPDGTNSNGTVYIPNTSDITVSMGNVTFNNYVDDVYVGNTTILNLVLEPGNNTLPIRGYVERLAVLGLVGTGGPYADTLKLPLTIVGNQSVYNWAHLEYYEYALKGANQSVILDVKMALG